MYKTHDSYSRIETPILVSEKQQKGGGMLMKKYRKPMLRIINLLSENGFVGLGKCNGGAYTASRQSCS